MVLDLGDHAAGTVPRGGLICEAPVADQRRVTGSASRPSQLILDPPLQDVVGREPDRIAHPAAFQSLVQRGYCECGIGPDHDSLPAPTIPINDGKKHLVPPFRAVDIAWSESCGEAVAFGVEHEERVIADELEVSIVRGLLLRSVDRALGTRRTRTVPGIHLS